MRTFSESVTNNRIRELLNQLLDEQTASSDYASAMKGLGEEFGNIIIRKLNDSSRLVLACTVEDADYLAKGMLDTVESAGTKVSLFVFWNKHFRVEDTDGISVASIVKEYREKGLEQANVLVVIKSVISSSCVVRTNLTRIIEEFEPSQIFIVSPVLLKGATTNLENEFDNSISNKFQYLYFAGDDQRTQEGIVIPGIGGNVYQRLGFRQDDKNRYVPTIVKERRQKAASS